MRERYPQGPLREKRGLVVKIENNILYKGMKPLYSKTEFEQASNRDLLPLECCWCGCVFRRSKKKIVYALSEKGSDVLKYCSLACVGNSQNKHVEVTCQQCGKTVSKILAEKKRRKIFFCNKSCAATYRNTHKEKGINRSKLEFWIEFELKQRYPGLLIDYNKKYAIESELDIYVPSLNFAVELNGIFHYEPIFGAEKLSKVKNNDKRKYQACIERSIELCIIDTSQMNYFKQERAKKFLNIICEIIDVKLLN